MSHRYKGESPLIAFNSTEPEDKGDPPQRINEHISPTYAGYNRKAAKYLN